MKIINIFTPIIFLMLLSGFIIKEMNINSNTIVKEEKIQIKSISIQEIQERLQSGIVLGNIFENNLKGKNIICNYEGKSEYNNNYMGFTVYESLDQIGIFFVDMLFIESESGIIFKSLYDKDTKEQIYIEEGNIYDINPMTKENIKAVQSISSEAALEGIYSVLSNYNDRKKLLPEVNMEKLGVIYNEKKEWLESNYYIVGIYQNGNPDKITCFYTIYVDVDDGNTYLLQEDEETLRNELIYIGTMAR